jgi:hypothetical protein
LGGTDVLFVEVVADDVVFEVGDLGAAHVFADGDELHLGGDDAGFGVGELGDDFAGLGLQDGWRWALMGAFRGLRRPSRLAAAYSAWLAVR